MSQSYLQALDAESRLKEVDARGVVSCSTVPVAFNAKDKEEKAHQEVVRFLTRKVEKLESERSELLSRARNEDDMLHPKTRKSYEMLVGAMAFCGYGYDPTAKKSKVPAEIANDLSKFGLELSPETIRNHIKHACRKHGIVRLTDPG